MSTRVLVSVSVLTILFAVAVLGWKQYTEQSAAQWESFAEALTEGVGSDGPETTPVEPTVDVVGATPSTPQLSAPDGAQTPGVSARVNGLVDDAKAALAEGRTGDAVMSLESALAIEPEHPVLMANLAYALYKRSEDLRAELRFDHAEGDLVRAVELAPEQPGYAAHLGNLALRRYRLDEAHDVLAPALELHPDNPDLWLLFADTLTLQGDLPGAIEAYTSAVSFATDKQRDVAQTLLDRARRQWDVEQDYLTDTTSSFVIRSPNDPSSPLWGPQLAGVLERARAEVGNALGTHPQQRATVILYDRETFRDVTGTHDWVGGLFDRKIRLSIRDMPLEDQRDEIESTFRHEYAHFIVSEIAPRCPAVLNEGIAQYVQHGRGVGIARLTNYLDSKGVPRTGIPEISELPDTFMQFTSQDEVSLAYLTSYAFIDHVVTMHGTIGVTGWLRELNGAPLAEAYQRANGRTLEAEERLFREQVRTER